MKAIHTIFTIAVALIMLSCEREPKTLFPIDINPNAACFHEAQVIEIGYTLHNAVTGNVSVTASSKAEWITDIDTSTRGIIKVSVGENNYENRTATITVNATGHTKATVELLQYSTPPEVANHTLMFYFFGTSLSRYFKTNIADAKEAISTGILGNNNRVIYLMQDSPNTATIKEILYDPATGECIDKELESITIDGEHITVDAIGNNIAKMAQYARAERYGIIFAGHGQGWITRDILNGSSAISTLSLTSVWHPAIGAEVTRAFGENNVQVNTYELAEGIEKSGVELDYILFDACFMSNIETIYDLRDQANYIIASPCEIMGRGFPYHRTLPHLFEDYGKSTDYAAAAESYHIFYRDEYSSNSRCGSIAVYDCREVAALAEATAEVIKSAKSNDEINIKVLQTYEGQDVHQFYDFGQWVATVSTDSSALEAFNNQLNRCVIAKYTLSTFYSAYGSYGTYKIDVDIYSGVTTSAPSEAYPDQWRETNWYKAVWE